MKFPTTKLIAITTALLLLSTIKRNRPIVYRKKWMEDWLLEYGTESLDGLWYEKVFDEWAKTNPERYRRTLRLPPAIFKQLLEMVEPYIKKQDTVMRKSIPPKWRRTNHRTSKFISHCDSQIFNSTSLPSELVVIMLRVPQKLVLLIVVNNQFLFFRRKQNFLRSCF